MNIFLTSLVFVFLAEMGDKTQLLAIALSTRYPFGVVMGGVLAATAANHLLAVVVGNSITAFIPMIWVETGAAVSFLLFGVWTVRGDTLEGEPRFTYGPFWTVAVAFFLAEMGDKTQLATLALAARSHNVPLTWLGTTAGMLLADAIGIGFGNLMGRKIPQHAVQWVAAAVFIAFGLHGLWSALPGWIAVPGVVAAGLLATGAAAFIAVKEKHRRQGGV